MSARIDSLHWRGRTHFGWPWGSTGREQDILSVDEERLTLTSTLGELRFRSEAVLRVERAGLIPCLWRGIRIAHRLRHYPDRVGFVPESASSKEVLERLKALGYWVLP